MPSVNDLYNLLKEDNEGLKHLLRERLRDGEALVLIVDQLEEVFTLTQDEKIRERFDGLLTTALTDRDGALHLITTIRSDFMMRFISLPGLQALLNEKASRYFLEPIDRAGLSDIVRSPAKLAGLRWSDETLPDDIVEEACAEPGALPLVENVLRLLWQKRGDNNVLRRDVYKEFGGVGGALAKSANALLDSLGTAKENALNLLTALVNVGQASQDTHDTRRTITKIEAIRAAGGGQQAEQILNQLSGLRGPETSRGEPARPRLIVISTNNSKKSRVDLVDLAHETLLRYDRNSQPFWKTLRDRVAAKRKMLEDRQLLEVLAKDWRDRGRPRFNALATGAQLRNFVRLPDVPEHAEPFLNASRRAIWLRNGVGVVLATIFFVIAWGWQKQLTPTYTVLNLLSNFISIHLEPEMVKINAGAFWMGEVGQGDESEQPAHKVEFQRAFKLGRYEVTFDEYDRFALATGNLLPLDEGWGRGHRPVINVTWEQAQSFASWLSKKTGKRYRLPSEAEWEYAARSGGRDEIWAGTSNVSQLEQYAWFSQNSNNRTQPVGTRKANTLEPQGLHDMSGNVGEWVEDCWHEDYHGAPSSGRSWKKENDGDCSARVIRGGSWSGDPVRLRTSHRDSNAFDTRFHSFGFRLAQDLE